MGRSFSNTETKEKLKNSSHNIEECVKWALEHENHNAFSDFFYLKTKSYEELFSEKLLQYIEEDRNKLYNWIIMKDAEWTNTKSENDFMPEDKKSKYVSKATKNRWIYGTALPTKYQVVQMGIYLGLSIEEIDELLLHSNNELLYPVNPIDAVCIYEIQKYLLKGLEKPLLFISNLKNRINTYCADIIYLEPLDEVYKNEVEDIEKRNQLIKNDEELDYITLFYQDSNNPEVFESLEDYMKGNRFVKLKLAFQKMTLTFLNNGCFMKNMYKTNINLVSSADFYDWNTEKKPINELCRKLCAKSKLSEKEIMDALNSIWNINQNLMLDDTDEVSRSARFTVVKNMVQGDHRDRKTFAAMGNGKHTARVNAIKYCLSTGNEEMLGEYLRLGTFWDVDYLQSYYYHDHIEKLDALLIYAFLYRDELINTWCHAWEQDNGFTMEEVEDLKYKLKKDFPMIKLITEIEQNIFNKAKNIKTKQEMCNKHFIFWERNNE